MDKSKAKKHLVMDYSCTVQKNQGATPVRQIQRDESPHKKEEKKVKNSQKEEADKKKERDRKASQYIKDPDSAY